MPESYTLLIIPKEKSSAKKVALPGRIITSFLVLFGVITLSFMYVVYDYINIKRSNTELARLKILTKEQGSMIDGLTARVEGFAGRIESLNQFERKIRIMANIERSPNKQQLLGVGGPMPEEARAKAKHEGEKKALIADLHHEIDQLAREAEIREKSLAEMLEYFREQKSIKASTPSLWPVMGWVTSEYGQRNSPFTGEREFHAGIDIATRMGKPIIAPADGLVTEVGFRQDFGNLVKIDHGHGYSTLYGHLLRPQVKEGGTIKRGQVLGYVGNSGQSTGPHLHYAVFRQGAAVNPRKYLN